MLPEDEVAGEPNGVEPPSRREADFLRLWRLIAIGVATALIAFTVIIDSLGRLYVRSDFHVSEILFGALVSAWLVLLGFEGKGFIDRIRGGGNGTGRG